MRANVTLLHHDYPSHLREDVESRLLPLQRFHDREVRVEARLERVGEEHRVELVATVERGAVLVADVTRPALSESLDEALDRLRRQLKRHHERRIDKRHGGSHRGTKP